MKVGYKGDYMTVLRNGQVIQAVLHFYRLLHVVSTRKSFLCSYQLSK